MEETLELGGGRARHPSGVERPTHLSRDLALADDDRLESTRHREKMLCDRGTRVHGERRAQLVCVDSRALGDASDGAFRGDLAGRYEGFIDIEVRLESVAGRENDRTGDESAVVDEIGADGRTGYRESLEQIEGGGSVARRETEEHAVYSTRRGTLVSVSPLAPSHPLNDGRTAESALVRAYRGVRDSGPPVWFMRQAGRSLPEYRAIREGVAMLDSCLDPAAASEITLQPVRRHGVDAAIFFSDIVIPLKLAGVGVEIVAGRGPVLDHPIRTAADVARLREHPLPEEALEPVTAGVRATVEALGSTPLIGFAGAPFTLAAYLVEGGPSKDHLRARAMMLGDPETWRALMEWTANITGAFLRAQIMAGASAGQLFDSWAGSLAKDVYERNVLWASRRALDVVRDLDVPLVHFGVGTGELLPSMLDAGVDVVGVDWRTPLDEASRRLGGRTPVQGNLDSALLTAPWPILDAAILDTVERGRSAPSHVFNLGHGVPADADPGVLTRIVDRVHELGAEAA